MTIILLKLGLLFMDGLLQLGKHKVMNTVDYQWPFLGSY